MGAFQTEIQENSHSKDFSKDSELVEIWLEDKILPNQTQASIDLWTIRSTSYAPDRSIRGFELDDVDQVVAILKLNNQYAFPEVDGPTCSALLGFDGLQLHFV